MMDFDPPIVGCMISNRNYAFGLLKATKECVIKIQTVQLSSVMDGNWEYWFLPKQITTLLTTYLSEMTQIYGRG
jgi:hypothetical protein